MPNALMLERVARAMVSSEPTGWKMPVSRAGSPDSDAERDDVLDLEVDRVADGHAVAQPVLVDLDRRALDAEALADQRHRAPPSARRADR